MGKILNYTEATTKAAKDKINSIDVVNKVNGLSKEATTFGEDTITLASRAVVLALSKAWIGIGIVNPATTTNKGEETTAFSPTINKSSKVEAFIPEPARYDTNKMWVLKLGDYFMPLSQSYTARASKRLNVSSLVDGIDIIQQTRKEAKTIDCVLRISVNESLKNLQLIKMKDSRVLPELEIAKLQGFLSDLYEKDIIFKVDNAILNYTFNIEYVIMTSYRFIPKIGSKTFNFEFSLTEVKYGDNVLTFDSRQIVEDRSY